MEYRYRDKAYLSHYSLDTKLFDYFDFLVEDAAPIRSVYILNTDKGLKILKKVDYSMDELGFLYNSLNIIRKKYPYVINFRESIDGKPYVKYEDGIYVVLDIIEGRDCVFENPIDLKKAASALAKLHMAGEEVDIENTSRKGLGKLMEKYEEKLRAMEKYKEIANMHVNKSEFDEIYLKYADYYISCIKRAYTYLEKSNYKELCRLKHTLCHHDLAHHNILIGKDDNVYFIDFDYSVVDLPYHDISNIITKAIKHNEWDIGFANVIMEGYMENRELSRDEIAVLYAYLLFPQDFYDIASNYYMKTRGWEEDEFRDKLKRKAEYMEDREKFLKEFENRWLQA
ncbi:MAG: CotS family spore coat protein [Clostridiales bacterium]|nr:CotS family spore coat protein [Clostridiales bacterium]